jgi:hypothetical protein
MRQPQHIVDGADLLVQTPLSMGLPQTIETPGQAATRLGVTTRTINRRIRLGRLVAIRTPAPGRNGFINLLPFPQPTLSVTR